MPLSTSILVYICLFCVFRNEFVGLLMRTPWVVNRLQELVSFADESSLQ
jgi:hypothetical protein